jgi:hypothetical protein
MRVKWRIPVLCETVLAALSRIDSLLQLTQMSFAYLSCGNILASNFVHVVTPSLDKAAGAHGERPMP